MALTHPDASRNALAAAIAALVDAGAGTNGVLEIYETGTPDTLLASIALQSPAFLPPGDLTTPGDDAGTEGVIIYAGLPLEDPDAPAAGVADKFQVKDTDGNIVYQGTVGLPASGADLELSNTTIAVLDAVRINPGSGWAAPV